MERLGAIVIPDPPTIGDFPLQPDYGTGMDYGPPIVVHTFDQPGLKTEQRILLGPGARRFRIAKDHLSCQEYDLLKAHFAQAQGQYAQFSYYHPVPGGAREHYPARYENPYLTLEQMVGMLVGGPGITLLEVPQDAQIYTSVARVTRFPDDAFSLALRGEVQRIIPLITVTPRDGSAPWSVSNQYVKVDAQIYQPRLADWSGISQTLDESSDSARFVLGNADGVFYDLANTTNLYRARIQFSLYHVGSGYLCDLWSGYALPWSFDSDGQFLLSASDGVFELGMGYPTRQLSRTCWKVYKGRFCPSPSPLPDCPKSYEACVERLVPHSFGGAVANPQAVHVKDNSTGVWGWGRSSLTSVTVIQDTVYERPVQEVYTDIPMKVACDVAGGRDEGDFYSALGIVGEGPVSSYATNLTLHTLDGQPPHDPLRGGGWRGILGNDPAADRDFFGLDQDPWNTVPDKSTYAAGLAFAEIRRTDQKGLQLSLVADRAMTVTVTGGIGGWTWTAPGQRVWTPALANCVWVAVNVYLRGLGLRADPDHQDFVPTEVMEQYFDVNQAIASAAICDLTVDKLVGTGQERQFPFRGALKERKPLKDWLREILNCCLGYYTFVNGKLWIGIRENSSVLAGNAFTRATILFKSLEAVPLSPGFNWLVGQFGDEEFEWQLNSVTVYDMDAAALAGTADSPQYLQSTINYAGVSNKSQAARLITTRLREEIGGVGPAEQRNARNLKFSTSVLALKTMVGDVISVEQDPRLPNQRVENRVQRWLLNSDYSITIEGKASTDSMYALDFGPKPDDVPAELVPPERVESPNGLAWMPNEVAPFPGDPLYPDPNERTFALEQDYNITRDGNWDPALWVRGEMVINQFASNAQPRIVGVTLEGGGTLAGGQTIYLAVTERDDTGQPVTPSNLGGIWIPVGDDNRAIRLELLPAAGSWAGWDLWVGTDRRAIAHQESHDGALPLEIVFAGPISPMTQELPENAARQVEVKAKHVWHSGVAGVLVTSVTAPNQIQCNDFIRTADDNGGPLDEWVGNILTALADVSDGSAPLWNFNVTAFNHDTGTFTVYPDCVRETPEDSVQEGDVLIVRHFGVDSTATTVRDPLWNNFVARNQFNSPGLRPDEEIGRVYRIIRGVGAGQFRRIVGNSADTIMLDPPWDVIPTAESVLIVEAADYSYFAHTSDLQVPRSGSTVEIRTRVDNLADRVALVGGFLVDDRGRLSDEPFAVFREIFVYGQPPTVRVVGPEPLAPDGGTWFSVPTDHTIRGDTSQNDVTVQLSPLAAYQGRTLYLVNDLGPFDLIVICFEGEFLFDGANMVTVQPFETLKVTAG